MSYGLKTLRVPLVPPFAGLAKFAQSSVGALPGSSGPYAGRAGCPIEAGAERDGVAVLAVGAEVAGIVRVRNLRRSGCSDRASSDRSGLPVEIVPGYRGADRASVVQAPRPVVKGELRVEISVRGRDVEPGIAQRDLAAVPGPAPHAEARYCVLPPLPYLPAGLDHRAVEIALQDDVDHAADGVRAVGRRRAVQQQVDAFDREGGNDRGIDLAEAVALRRIAHAVDHHQRAGAPSRYRAVAD